MVCQVAVPLSDSSRSTCGPSTAAPNVTLVSPGPVSAWDSPIAQLSAGLSGPKLSPVSVDRRNPSRPQTSIVTSAPTRLASVE